MISPISFYNLTPIYNHKRQNKPEHKITSSYIVAPAYSSNVSFTATNVDLITQMENTKDIDQIKKLFTQMTQKAQSNVNGLVKKFKEYLTFEEYIQACIKQPPLFCRSPETIEKNVLELVKKFEKEGLTTDKYLGACIKQPSLFARSPETIEKNVLELVKKFEKEGLTTDKYLGACIELPSLFCQSPETIEKNVLELVKKFEKEGLTTDKYLRACIKQPQLFYQSPETIEKNVLELVKKFEKEGLAIDKYLGACIKQPQLFYQSPETIEKNVLELVKKFEKEGLTTDKYLGACIKQPSLFARSPETIEKNVLELVKKFEKEGLTTDKYLGACIKLPPLFYLSPETIEEHIKAYMYCDLNKGGKIDLQKIITRNLTYSTSLIYIKYLLVPQLQSHNPNIKQWGQSGLKPKLISYLEDFINKNPNGSITIKVKKGDMTENFISTINDFTLKNLGRDDIFNYVVTP